MSISSGLLDGVCMDFMGFIPIMTHMFNPEKVNNRFNFLLDPCDYCKSYTSKTSSPLNNQEPDAEGKEIPLIIHNVGLLKKLTENKMTQHHFWHNLFNKEDCQTHLRQMRDSKLYAYAPYIVKPDFCISLNPDMLHTNERIKYSDLSTEIRLFPHGATVAHLKVYIKSALSIEDIVNLQNALTKEPIFNLTQPTATKLGLKFGEGITLQLLFSAIGQCIWKTLYLGKPGTIDKTTLVTTHRIINPLGDIILTDADVAAIMSLSKKPKFGEIEDVKQSRVDKVLEQNTVLAFYHGATLLYAPKTESNVSCFKNNYSNVVEFSLLQDFFLNAINDALDKNTLNFEELFASESALAACLSFSHYSKYMFGGHRRLFKIVMRKTACEQKRRKLENMSEIYAPASLIIKQMKEPQNTLLTMMNNLDGSGSFEGLIEDRAVIRPVYDLGVSIKTNIQAAMDQIEQQELAMFPNFAALQALKTGILTQMEIYNTKYLFKYKNLVENLLANKEVITKAVDKKRDSGAKVPDQNTVNDLLENATKMLGESKNAEPELKKTEPQNPKSFFEKAKPYLGVVVGAATAVLKALGYMPV